MNVNNITVFKTQSTPDNHPKQNIHFTKEEAPVFQPLSQKCYLYSFIKVIRKMTGATISEDKFFESTKSRYLEQNKHLRKLYIEDAYRICERLSNKIPTQQFYNDIKLKMTKTGILIITQETELSLFINYKTFVQHSKNKKIVGRAHVLEYYLD